MRNFYTRKFPAAAPARPMDPPSLPHLSPPSSSRARPFPPLTHYLIHYLRSHAFRASNIRPRLRVPPSTEECRRKQDANSDSDGSKSLRSLQLRYWSRELHPDGTRQSYRILVITVFQVRTMPSLLPLPCIQSQTCMVLPSCLYPHTYLPFLCTSRIKHSLTTIMFPNSSTPPCSASTPSTGSTGIEFHSLPLIGRDVLDGEGRTRSG
jgi:hypothetical protein